MTATAPDDASGPADDARAEQAVAAAVAATFDRPVVDDGRPARRAAHVIAAITAHRRPTVEG